jgi:WD40 repeat protein
MNKFFILSVFIVLILHGYTTIYQSASIDIIDVTTISWSPDGTRIAGLSSDSNIYIWDVEDLTNPILSFQVGIADEIRWTPDSQYLVVQGTKSEEKHLQMSATKWDATTGGLVETLMTFQMDTSFEYNLYGYYVFPTLVFNRATTQTAFSYRDGLVFISDGFQVLHLDHPAPTNHVYQMEWSPDNKYIAIAYGSSDSYVIQVFNTESGEMTLLISQMQQYFVIDMEWDATGTYLATLSTRFTCCESWSNIGVYHIESEKEPKVQFSADRWWEGIDQNNTSMAWHPNELWLAIATEDAIKIFDPFTEDAVSTISVEGVSDLIWSPDGTKISGVLPDSTIQIWKASLD